MSGGCMNNLIYVLYVWKLHALKDETADFKQLLNNSYKKLLMYLLMEKKNTVNFSSKNPDTKYLPLTLESKTLKTLEYI